MSTAPKSQPEYIAELQRLDNDVVAATTKSHEAMHSYRAALRARDAAALAFAMSARRPSLAEAMREVSDTQRRVQTGELTPPPESRPGPSKLDRDAFYSQGARFGQRSGGGDAFRRGAKPTQKPKAALRMGDMRRRRVEYDGA